MHGHALVAHMTRHAHVFPDATWSGAVADGAVAAVRLGTMRCALALEIVLLHHALETFALGFADNVDPIARLKLRDREIDVAFRSVFRETKFPNELFRFRASLGKPAQQSSTQFKYDPGLAVDGDVESCSLTPRSSEQRWWQVHLGEPVRIQSVSIAIKTNLPQKFTVFIVGMLFFFTVEPIFEVCL